MKIKAAVSTPSFPSTPRRTVVIGEIYGDLEVLEEASRYKTGERRWLCRCLRIVERGMDGRPDNEGRICGQTTIRRHTEIVKATAARACKVCTQVSLRLHRRNYSRGLTYR